MKGEIEVDLEECGLKGYQTDRHDIVGRRLSHKVMKEMYCPISKSLHGLRSKFLFIYFITKNVQEYTKIRTQ